MRVKLESVGNPDFRQDPDQPLFGCEPNKLVPVANFRQARDLCMKFINDNDLGSGNWAGGEVMDENNKVIAHISYNGRVWEGEMKTFSPSTKEIKI